ncbi:MAG: beta-lactamase family protein, partial [Alphaproteobacteria bacterium]|nr:beta-lactamase family protein [Alphaproteobacteria bacterium]
MQKLDQYIAKQVEQKKVIGCSVAVVEGNRIIFMKAYGVKKKGGKDKVNLDTSFQLGSASKPIAATLIALLNKQGLINLDAPITPFYPYLKSRTTLRHVLTHTTGFKRKGWNHKIENGILRSQLLKDLKTAEQDEPGIEFDYHNVVYSLMEDVVEGTQNQKMEALLQQKLLTPLGMNQTTIGYEAFISQPNCAWPHQVNKKGTLY